MKTPPIIKNEEGQEVPVEIIANEIIKVADGFEALSKSRLTRRAIIVLLKDATGMGQGDIERVLRGAENLKSYLKK